MKIQVTEDMTGYAPRSCRFTAYDADTYDWAPDQKRASSIGYGATPSEATRDLLEIIADEEGLDAEWLREQQERYA
ncbi:MAG TPA: hypothetical protein VJO13_06250 [Ktedonobacterales bacterium]|nr:hypothetical protein [Ktedonobacterales bacterium]